MNTATNPTNPRQDPPAEQIVQQLKALNFRVDELSKSLAAVQKHTAPPSSGSRVVTGFMWIILTLAIILGYFLLWEPWQEQREARLERVRIGVRAGLLRE